MPSHKRSSGQAARPAHDYRPDIDGLRAIAVLSVVGYHAFPSLIPGGYIGVDIFFVISGYLISSIILADVEDQRFSFLQFYGRRIRRIFPALGIILAAAAAYAWFALLPGDYEKLGKHIVAAAGFVANFALWAESGYFDAAAESKPLLHLWSLGIEEQFYLVWPPILWLLAKTKKNRTGSLILFLAAVSFAANVAVVRHDAMAAFYSPATRFWEIMIGAILAWQTLRGRAPLEIPAAFSPLRWRSVALAWPDLLSVSGLLLIGAGLALLRPHILFPGWWALLPCVGAYLVIASGPKALPNRLLLANRAMVGIGLISYPLYLWHWPILSFGYLETHVPSREFRAGAVLIAMLLAWLTYWYVEKPIRFGALRIVSPAAFATAAAVGAAGGYIYMCGGFPSRYPDAEVVEAIADFKYNYAVPFQEGTCFLQPAQSWKAFDSCPPPQSSDKPLLLLWGDSHAAQLYSGYKAVYGDDYAVMQRSASACPPLLDFKRADRPYCPDINKHTLEYIAAQHPAKVVLAARWSAYNWASLDKTVERLRALDVRDIDLVGPVLRWPYRVNIHLYKKYATDPSHRIATRLTSGFDPAIVKTDQQMAALAARFGIDYYSPLHIFCNPEGCLARVGDDPGDIVTFDYDHLTANGAIFLVSHFKQ